MKIIKTSSFVLLVSIFILVACVKNEIRDVDIYTETPFIQDTFIAPCELAMDTNSFIYYNTKFIITDHEWIYDSFDNENYILAQHSGWGHKLYIYFPLPRPIRGKVYEISDSHYKTASVSYYSGSTWYYSTKDAGQLYLNIFNDSTSAVMCDVDLQKSSNPLILIKMSAKINFKQDSWH